VNIYKMKGFARFQRKERIDDEALLRAVREAEGGLVHADLGSGLIKQRVARRGAGKRGGYRTVIAFRRGARAVFLLGFAKSERDNIADDELDELRRQAKVILSLSQEQIAAMVAGGDMREVNDEHGENG
jgi:hypothetical protein